MRHLAIPIHARVLAERLGLYCMGDDVLITGVASLDSPHATAMTFSRSPRFTRKAGVVIADVDETTIIRRTGLAVICSKSPRLDFARAVVWLQVVSGSAEGVVRLGAGCQIDSTAKLGKNGFGYEGSMRIPHIGGVTIGANVEIGAHSCVDRGTIDDTIIEDDVKIDNLVHVAHNVRIRRGAKLIAGALIGGGCDIGERVWIGLGACIREKVRIADDVLVGMGAVVIKDVPSGVTVIGNPAKALEDKRM